MNKDKSNKDTNLVKSTTNDQIENNNDINNNGENNSNDNIISNCDVCEYNPKNRSPLSKKEQFLNIFNLKVGEEFYIKDEKERGAYSIYHFTSDLNLIARTPDDKDGSMSFYSPTLPKLLNENIEIVKL